MPIFTNSAARDINKKMGENPSVRDFLAVGDGVADDQPAFQDAVDSVVAAGGHKLFIPPGTYKLSTPWEIPATAAGLQIFGAGTASIIKRGATLPIQQGLVDVLTGASSVALSGFLLEGDTTTVTGLTYGGGGDFNNDPQNDALSRNSSIWIHGGCSDIVVRDVDITHTGGYAINVDARDANISGLLVDSCRLYDNRPHLFGTSGADENYGAWTGGILFQGDCRTSASKLFSVKGAVVTNSSFNRMNGNCIWMHSYGFDVQHENFVIEGNTFRHIARDAFMAGNLTGGGCKNNHAFYVGWAHYVDGDTPVPKYLANHYAVGFDSSGYVSNFNYIGNSVTEFYGGAFDLDGLRDSVVSGNTSKSTQSIAKGLQTGDTSVNGGGKNVTVSGNYFSGCNAGAIVLNQADTCLCEGNTIDHPSAASTVPILLYSTNLQTKNTTVRGNVITYPVDTWCIAESDGGTGTGFDSTTINQVYDNLCLGARGEFLRNANSASLTGIRLSTNDSAATNKQETAVQREGAGSSAALKIKDTQGSTQTQYMQIAYANGMMNVSKNGATQTGSVVTGARSSLGYADAMWSGKLMSDGFMAIYDYAGAATSYLSADANSLDANWILFRNNKTAGYVEVSLTTSVGVRVWTQFGGGSGISGLTAGRVPYATSGTAIANSATYWDNTNTRLGVNKPTPLATLHVGGGLVVDGTATAASITLSAGYVDSSEGFRTTAVATNSIQAPSGGVTALYLIGTSSLTLTTDAAAPVGSSGQGRFRFNGTKFQASENGGAYVDVIGSSISGLTTGKVPYATSSTSIGNSGLTWDNANTRLGVNKATPGTTLHVGGQGYFDGAVAGAGITCADGYVESTEGFLATVALYNTFQNTSGGVNCRNVNASAYSKVGSSAGVPAMTSGDSLSAGTTYWDSSLGRAQIYNGSSWTNFYGLATVNGLTVASLTISRGTGIGGTDSGSTVSITNTGVTFLTGTTNQVNVSASTGSVTLSLPQSIATGSNVTFNTITTADAIQSNRGTGPAIYAPNAYIQGKGLVSSGLSAYNSIQSDAGISSGSGANGGFYVAATQVVNTSGVFIGPGVNIASGDIKIAGNVIITSGGILSNPFGVNVNAGCAATGFNIYGGASGQSTSFSVAGTTYTFTNGILTSVV
jgi:hypothetical protein